MNLLKSLFLGKEFKQFLILFNEKYKKNLQKFGVNMNNVGGTQWETSLPFCSRKYNLMM